MNEDPPQDGRAEDSVLGAMLIRKDAIPEVLPLLRADDFYFPNNGAIYRAIQTLFTRGDPVDSLTLKAELESHGQFIKVGGGSKILELTQLVPTAVNASHYAKIVAEKSRLRAMSSLGMQLYRLAHTEGHGADELLEQAERFFSDVREPPKGALNFDELLTSWQGWVADTEDVIPSPWEELNNYLGGGFRGGKCYIVGGRPGAGKSLTGLNIAQHAAENGSKALIFSMEMKRAEIASRLLAGGAWADYGQIFRRDMDKDTWSRIEEYMDTKRDIQLAVIDQSNISVEQIAAQIRAHKPDIAFIDYMQLISVSGNESRREKVDHISRTLKVTAGESNTALVIASQLNRDSSKNGGRPPTIADLRESGGQEADADVVMLLHRPESDPNIVRLGIGKNRDGKQGTIEFVFRGKYARIG